MNEITPEFDVEQLNKTLQEVSDSRTPRTEKKYFCRDSQGAWVAKTNSEISKSRKSDNVFTRLSIEEISLIARNIIKKEEKFDEIGSENTHKWHGRVLNISRNIKQLNQERMNKNKANSQGWGEMLFTALLTNVFRLFTIVWDKSGSTIVNETFTNIEKEAKKHLKFDERIKEIKEGKLEYINALENKNIERALKDELEVLVKSEPNQDSRYHIFAAIGILTNKLTNLQDTLNKIAEDEPSVLPLLPDEDKLHLEKDLP